MRLVKSLILAVFFTLLLFPSESFARNKDIPPYDGTSNTHLRNDSESDAIHLQLEGNFLIRSSPLIDVAEHHTADGNYIDYPTVFNGTDEPQARVINVDYSEPYVRIQNEAHVTGIGMKGDRMISEIERFNDSIFRNKYNGNPDYVKKRLRAIEIENINGTSYGKFYWIRDIAYMSGGYAGAGSVAKSVNVSGIYYVRTSYPDITKLTASGNSLIQPVSIDLEAYEYVSKGKFSTGIGQTFNPYGDDSDRNIVTIKYEVYKDGKLVHFELVTKRSTPQLNPAKPNEKEAGYIKETLKFQPQECGNYTVKVFLTDSVERSADEKTTSFTVNQDCDATPPPPTGGGGSGDETPPAGCQAPPIIGGDLRYDYELDLSVTRIEGETVDKNTTTRTPVTVFRKDFSANRDKVRNEIQQDKARAESELEQLRSQRLQLESQKASLEAQLEATLRARNSCMQQPPDENGNPPDCSHFDGAIQDLQSQIDHLEQQINQLLCDIATKKAEIAGFQKELDDLKALEDQWKVVNTNVELTFNGSTKGNQSVSLTEGQTRTLNSRLSPTLCVGEQKRKYFCV